MLLNNKILKAFLKELLKYPVIIDARRAERKNLVFNEVQL